MGHNNESYRHCSLSLVVVSFMLASTNTLSCVHKQKKLMSLFLQFKKKKNIIAMKCTPNKNKNS